jgi:CBS domain containing-hemolysin-like protein
VSVDEIEDELHVKLPEGEFDSLGGFILDQLGRVPSAGESVIWQGWEFTAEVVSENRIQRVRVVRKAEEGEDAEGEQEGAELG